MHEDKYVGRVHPSCSLQVPRDCGIEVSLHCIAASASQRNFDHHYAVGSGHSIEGAAVGKIAWGVVRHHIEQFIGWHSDAVDQRLVYALHDGFTCCGGGVLGNIGSDERHGRLSVVKEESRFAKAVR
ncbi:hypothetical protein D3C72_1974280 [compost metagenome]